jgi:hypothetical protein
MSTISIQKIIDRILRMIKLDNSVYREIAKDENATYEAGFIVIVATLLGALGAAIGAGSVGMFFVRLIIGVLVNWLLWSYVTMLVGTNLFQGKATFWEMARTLGYASAPAVLGILGALTCLAPFIGLIALVLSLVAAVLAVRETQELSTEKAILTCVIGWVVVLIVSIIITVVL